MVENASMRLRRSQCPSESTDIRNEKCKEEVKTRGTKKRDVGFIIFMAIICVSVITRETFGKYSTPLVEHENIIAKAKRAHHHEQRNKEQIQFSSLQKRKTEFPCHYVNNREDEFDIEPFVNQNFTLSASQTISNGEIYDVSIVTIMSPTAKMLSQLSKMCESWSGPISIAVFINSTENKAKAQELIREFNNRRQENVGHRDEQYILSNVTIFDDLNTSTMVKETNVDRISFHFVTDMDPGNRGADQDVFPRNLLRNVAIEYSYTEHIFMLDIDFVISENSYANMKTHLQHLDDRTSNGMKYALVVPAFEVEKHLKYSMAKNKGQILKSLKEDKRNYRPFLIRSKYKAHTPTNYKKWYRTSQMYSINAFKHDYEPYIAIPKSSKLPPLWEHFTGFGRNKLTWIEEVNLSGYKFYVDQSIFVIHRWHPEYGFRRVRPFIAKEYVDRFQKYVKKIYGRNVRSMDKFYAWRDKTQKSWTTFVKEKHLVSTGHNKAINKRMKQDNARRREEFATCISILNEKYSAKA